MYSFIWPPQKGTNGHFGNRWSMLCDLCLTFSSRPFLQQHGNSCMGRNALEAITQLKEFMGDEEIPITGCKVLGMYIKRDVWPITKYTVRGSCW